MLSPWPPWGRKDEEGNLCQAVPRSTCSVSHWLCRYMMQERTDSATADPRVLPARL